MWAVSAHAHGSLRPAGLGVLDELPVRSRNVAGLKYQDGAVKVMGVVFGAARLRTSSSWYPWQS